MKNSKHTESLTPANDYQACLEHALTMAHILEHATMFLPMDCELWHRAGVELGQFSGWINRVIQADATRLDARRKREGR
jgi:hypothetical protein